MSRARRRNQADVRSEARPPECRRIAALLPALPDGDLAAPDRALVEAHLASCPTCQTMAKAFLDLGGLLQQVPVPDAVLPAGVEAVARILEREAERSRRWRLRIGRKPVLALAVVAVAALLVVRFLPLGPKRATNTDASSWSVARLEGAPKVGATPIGGTGRLRIGQSLETDGASRAQLQVANIGQVEIEPNSRVRLVETQARKHQLALDRGALRARITAPPRLFFVETPSALAVDLGCAYRLKVDDAGGSHLCVTSGWVAFVAAGRETVVPAGVCCDTRRGIGPGTPYLEDSPAALRRALTRFDFERGGSAALGAVLAAATAPDSLTLWYLLSRVPPGDRGAVYDRLEALTPPPSEVTREGVLQLDPRMLDLWRREIEDMW